MYGIIDCDNCFVSCERVFRPDLTHKPVVVLSNNDGCVVARSNEAKQLGIKMGMPYFRMLQQFKDQEITAFSSNYELYGELTSRVIEIIKQEAPHYFRYSIDECFVYLHGMERVNLKTWGENLHKRIKKSVGMPVSIGIAPTKTLAKIASHFAKKYLGYHHCCIIDSDEKRIKALKLTEIGDVWGIGRRYAAKLQNMDINTAFQFSEMPKERVKSMFNNVTILRTWQEINGIDAIPNETLSKKQSICTSRSFNGLVSDFETLSMYVSNYAGMCAEKLRKQNSVASIVGVFISTNRFRDDLPQDWKFKELNLMTPTNSSILIIKTAISILKSICKDGYSYKKAGVIVMGITDDTSIQLNIFDYDAESMKKMHKLDSVIDKINKINGSETVKLGVQQFDKINENGKREVFANMIKHDFRSKNPTTRWSDIIRLK